MSEFTIRQTGTRNPLLLLLLPILPFLLLLLLLSTIVRPIEVVACRPAAAGVNGSQMDVGGPIFFSAVDSFFSKKYKKINFTINDMPSDKKKKQQLKGIYI